MKNVMDFSIDTLVFWVVGFSIMFGPSIGGFIGLPNFFFTADYGNDVPDMAILMFQTVFAATTATIVSGAIIIGALAGVVIVFGIELIDKVLRVDDPVGAITVHGLTGAMGTLMVWLFATEGGLFYGGGWSLLGIQALGVVVVGLWSFSAAYLLFTILKKTMGLRVTRKEEEEGLDIHEHGQSSYNF